MKIIILHNLYQVAGGEDQVLNNETKLLKFYGELVKCCRVDNSKIFTFWEKTKTMFASSYSFYYRRHVISILLREKPDVVHVHNYFPIFSPSIFFACKSTKTPVVHTLHNYRAVCPTALLMHDGKINEKSLKGSAWWAVSKRVYRNSFIGSFALAFMVEIHKWLGTWNSKIDRYIALTEFSRLKYIEAGWPEHKVVVKPNFIEDPFDNLEVVDKSGGYALYLGRLSEEKGIDILFDAWDSCKLPLKVIGDGPLKNMVSQHPNSATEYLGLKDKPEVLKLVQNADFIVMPSTWYEGFPMVLVEAFACGTPALVSRLGSMEEIVEDGITGLHFEAGKSVDLAEKVQWMIDNPEQAKQMGQNARNEYLEKYTPEKNYEILMDIYQQAIEEAKLS